MLSDGNVDLDLADCVSHGFDVACVHLVGRVEHLKAGLDTGRAKACGGVGAELVRVGAAWVRRVGGGCVLEEEGVRNMEGVEEGSVE